MTTPTIPAVDATDLAGQLQRCAVWAAAVPPVHRAQVAIHVARLTSLLAMVVADTPEPED